MYWRSLLSMETKHSPKVQKFSSLPHQIPGPKSRTSSFATGCHCGQSIASSAQRSQSHTVNTLTSAVYSANLTVESVCDIPEVSDAEVLRTSHVINELIEFLTDNTHTNTHWQSCYQWTGRIASVCVCVYVCFCISLFVSVSVSVCMSLSLCMYLVA